jgi:hypothetical protein
MAGGGGTQAAVDAGLAWLAASQAPDGSWSGDPEETGLALLAFLATGATDRAGPHPEPVAAGLAWLERHPGSSGPAAMALAEAFALTGDERWRRAARDAVSRTGSGLALRIARLCGVPPTSPIPAPEGDGPRACLLRMLDGDSPCRSAALAQALEALLAPVEEVPTALDRADDDLLHDGSLAAFQAGGTVWTHWNAAMKKAVVGSQVRTGEDAGSWNPPAGGSRIRTTALRTATLSVYYRYRRLFSGSVDGR